jgi:hypothetical protein
MIALNLFGYASGHARHKVIEIGEHVFYRRQACLKVQFLKDASAPPGGDDKLPLLLTET